LGDEVVAKVVAEGGGIEAVVAVVLVEGADIEEGDSGPGKELGFFAIVALAVWIVVVVGLTFDGKVRFTVGTGATIEDGKVYFGANPEFPKVAVLEVVVAIAGAHEFQGNLGTAAIVGVEGLQEQFEQFPHAGFVAVDDGSVVKVGGGHGL